MTFSTFCKKCMTAVLENHYIRGFASNCEILNFLIFISLFLLFRFIVAFSKIIGNEKQRSYPEECVNNFQEFCLLFNFK